MNKYLVKEFDYYLENKDELFKQYPHKFVIIKNLKVIGIYDNLIEADTR